MKKLPFVISKSEALEIIQKEPDYRNKFLMKLMLYTGMRVSEALALKVEDIDAKYETLKVEKGKGKKQRIVIIPSEFRTELKLVAPQILPFNITRQHVWLLVRRASERAGFGNSVHPHTFRHIHACNLRTAGTDLEAIAEQLGHSSLNTTRIYDHLDVKTRKKITRWE